jgi:hypothetical protein
VPDATENESATFPDPAGGAYHPLLVKRSPAALAACALLLFGACREAGVGGGEASSDGLVFVRRGEGSDSDIWQARLSDGAERQLLRTPGRAETWPYWSGALHRLVVQLPPRGRSGPQLVLLDPETGGRRPRARERPELPEWSPDGRRLYSFRTYRDGVAVARRERPPQASGRAPGAWPPSPGWPAAGSPAASMRPLLLFLPEPAKSRAPSQGGADDKGRFTRDGARSSQRARMPRTSCGAAGQ